ncbi:MAG: pilus assembly protein PilO, partial [Cyanobacteriota bacterium]|nr:pilus assembly protein PilO [Cyanobacteriota bacterium]
MTFSDEMNFEGSEFEEDSSSAYPVVFGITFTPKVSGILIGVLGLAGAGYMFLNILKPAWDNFTEKQGTKAQLETEIQGKEARLQSIDELNAKLAQAKTQQSKVWAVFANEKTLDTLLLDLNR